MATAQSDTTIDDARVRVTTWTFQDGDETEHHRHEYDYIVVPVTGGLFMRTFASGAATTVEQLAGTPFAGDAGAEHNLINAGGRPAIFVEIEFKTGV